VVSEAALDKANDHIEKIERDLRTFKNHCNTLDAELDARDAAIKQLTKLLLKARELLDREMPCLDSNKKWEDFCELVVEINRAIAVKEAM
jgi:ABC-type transporter Mla subunit MlaD